MTVSYGNHAGRSLLRTWVHVAVLLCLFAGASNADAQPPSSHRDAAIALGEEGLVLLDRGDYTAALSRFEAANDLVPAPTFAVRAALCLEYLGRLVEALRRYEQAASMQLDPSWPEIHAKAQADARRRAAELRKRVGRLYVVLRGDTPEQASVQVDGKEIPFADLASAVLLDPGDHSIQVLYGNTVERRKFAVGEGQQHQERFTVGTLTTTDTPTSSTQQKIGWVGVGMGAAGLAIGTVAGLVAWNKKGDLDSRCPDRVCPPEAWSDNDSYYGWRNASTVGFSVGAVCLGAGAVLLLTDKGSEQSRDADSARQQSSTRFEPWIGATSAGVRGTF